jgi:hypothetical protein
MTKSFPNPVKAAYPLKKKVTPSWVRQEAQSSYPLPAKAALHSTKMRSANQSAWAAIHPVPQSGNQAEVTLHPTGMTGV